jgi:uncharacterized membrane protein (UPF0127 family)
MLFNIPAARVVLLLLLLSNIANGIEKYDARTLRDPWVTSVRLEHAVTDDQLSWGLMQRRSLAENSGMTFNFPTDEYRHFWMLNCLINLSIAYINENRMICEMHHMQAFPQRVKAMRPIRTLKDLKSLSYLDPSIQFFSTTGASSSFATHYALEVNENWFQQHNIRRGDIALWKVGKPRGLILHTANLDHLRITQPTLVEFDGRYPKAVWMTNNNVPYDIAYLSKEKKVTSVGKLKKNQLLPIYRKSVAISREPVKYALIAPVGWLAKNRLGVGASADHLISASDDTPSPEAIAEPVRSLKKTEKIGSETRR